MSIISNLYYMAIFNIYYFIYLYSSYKYTTQTYLFILYYILSYIHLNNKSNYRFNLPVFYLVNLRYIYLIIVLTNSSLIKPYSIRMSFHKSKFFIRLETIPNLNHNNYFVCKIDITSIL